MTADLLLSMEPQTAAIRDRIREIVETIPGHEGMKTLLMSVADNPGKMIRSRLMLLTAGERAEQHRGELIATAAALEMVHSASLILDDMIDDSPLRRGKPTIQIQYGKPIALCSGDYLLTTALRYLVDSGYTASAVELMDAVQAVCDGEMIQHENRRNVRVTEKAYLDAIRGKTAYAFLAACRIACRITGRPAEEKKALEKYGLNLGMMFQLRDDLLDWTEEESRLGKSVNEDFAEGVYTLPAIYTFAHKNYGGLLRTLAEKERLSTEERIRSRQIVRDAGGFSYAAETLKKWGAEAGNALWILEDSPHRSAMDGLIHLLEAGLS
jgi:heptaprenyl diphosphate synthase